MDSGRVLELSLIAARAKKHAIHGIYSAQSGHPGGSMSVMDIIVTLFFEHMHVNPKRPDDPGRDRFVLSKGHCAPALYGVLSELGFFSADAFSSLRQLGSFLQGHPDMKAVAGVDMSTGSLGQGVSAANGMALAAKIDGATYRVYVATGDGELEEGQCWEAAMFAPQYKLDNLTLFVDNNGLQIDGDISQVMNPAPIDEKYRAFGWHVINVDGHDYTQLDDAIKEAKATKGKPTAIICKTVKGKGISYMENHADWHGKAPGEELYQQAMRELDGQIAELEAKIHG